MEAGNIQLDIEQKHLEIGGYILKGDPYQEDWTLDAVCRQSRPDELFVRGAAQHRAARQNCADCPVQAACLREAIATGTEWGVWGGLTERQRRKLVRQMGGFVNALAQIDEARETAKLHQIEQNTHPERYTHLDAAMVTHSLYDRLQAGIFNRKSA